MMMEVIQDRENFSQPKRRSEAATDAWSVLQFESLLQTLLAAPVHLKVNHSVSPTDSVKKMWANLEEGPVRRSA
jgi:hypothetical protein